MKHELQCFIMIWKHEEEMNVEAKPRHLSLSNVFRPWWNRWNECFIWLLKLMGKRESNLFVYDCGTHYWNYHLVILHNKIDSGLEFYVIILLLDHPDNVFIVFFYTFGSAQLNMNGRVRKQECIRCLISKMRMRLPTICFPHSVIKG